MSTRTIAYVLSAFTSAALLGACSKPAEVPPPAASPAPAAMPEVPAVPAAPVATGNVSDVDISEHVKTALLQNDMLKGANITVVTLKGDVRLTGMLDSQAQVDEALKVARASDGAHTIHDELTVKK